MLGRPTGSCLGKPQGSAAIFSQTCHNHNWHLSPHALRDPLVCAKQLTNVNNDRLCFRFLNMYNHNIRFCIPVILCSSWLLATSAKAAPAPAQHAAGMIHTPLETDEDAIAHFMQADPVEDAKAMVQDLHTSYSTEVNNHLGDGCTQDNMIVRKEWWGMSRPYRWTCRLTSVDKGRSHGRRAKKLHCSMPLSSR